MNTDPRMQITMSQRLVMTPMLQQAIKLLQMSRLELVDLVKQELLENPVLEEIEETSEPSFSSEEEPLSSGETSQEIGGEQEGSSLTEPQNSGQDVSINWEEYFQDNPSGLGYSGEYDPDEGNNPSYENVAGSSMSLSEHLLWQLQMSQVSARDLKIGTFLIGQLNEHGYLCNEDASDASTVNIYAANLENEELHEYRARILENICQKMNTEFEHQYVAAKIDALGRSGVLAAIFVQDDYDLLLHGNYVQLIQKFQGLTVEELGILIALISELSVHDVAKLTELPLEDVISGFRSIEKISREMQDFIEEHTAILVAKNHEAVLEKTGVPIEELYAIEYFLSRLSPEEIIYLATKQHPHSSVKYEHTIRHYLEKLHQSYAHIHELKSHKYFLIQLYNVAVNILMEKFDAAHTERLGNLAMKLHPIPLDEIRKIGDAVQTYIDEFYTHETKITPEEVGVVLALIQTFSPAGIGARDIKECLLLQVRDLQLEHTIVDQIIQQHFAELEEKQYDEIAEKLGVPILDVELADKIISNMSPAPGADFIIARPEYIVPDIHVYKVGKEYEVVLNDDDLPNLGINPVYKKLILDNGNPVPNTAKQYVDQKLKSAIWFIRSVEQRKRTIYKVGKSIVKFQRDFLEHGVSHLKPLVLRDVADDISMHESTVSRVTTNKYIHTPQGVFELKYFFHSGLESRTGQDISSVAVKEQIRQMIVEESAMHPLSDKTIEKRLQKSGVEIARRTIAKYREELNIPSSVQRKREKLRGVSKGEGV